MILNFTASRYAFYSLFQNSRLYAISHEWKQIRDCCFHCVFCMRCKIRFSNIFIVMMLKNLLFSNSKSYFIYFNTLFYNTLNIKSSIFLPLHLNIIYLFFIVSFSLFLFVSLFSKANPHPEHKRNLPITFTQNQHKHP